MASQFGPWPQSGELEQVAGDVAGDPVDPRLLRQMLVRLTAIVSRAAAMARTRWSLRHADHYVPAITPAEALALARALARAAWDARPGAASAPSADPAGCPAWCEITDHDDWGEARHHLAWGVSLSAFPYYVHGERYLESALVILQQDPGREPVIVIEPAHKPWDEMPMTLDEAQELVLAVTGLIEEARSEQAADVTPGMIAELGDPAPGSRGDGKVFWVLPDAITLSAWGTAGEAPDVIDVVTRAKRWGLSLDEAELLATALMDLVRLGRATA